MAKPDFAFVNVPVPAALAKYVEGIVGFTEYGAAPVVRSESATLTIPLILVLGRGYTYHQSPTDVVDRDLGSSFVAGVHQKPAHIGTDGWSTCIQINLTVIGAFKLLRCHMADLANEVADLADVIGPVARELEGRLIELNDWSTRFQTTLSFLQAHILDGPSVNPYVEHALSLVQATNGDIRVQDITKEVGCSRKHLTNLFARAVGVSPKQVLRIARFEFALGLLQSPSDGIADIAAQAGYVDQSHLHHDVLAFTGSTPGSLIHSP
ncbi:MAG: helix-turn-helix transcriptional regulator [Pseudomonadota bacterium]